MTNARRPPLTLVLCWFGLLGLLGSTVAIAYVPLGAANTLIAMFIAAIKGLLVAAIFMELRERNPLTLTFAGAGFFWLGIMLWLALADYITRPNFPPAVHWGS